jgi:ABC-type multidrug transport system permease subunit
MTANGRIVLAVAAKEIRIAVRYPLTLGNLLILMPFYQLVLPALLLGMAFMVGSQTVGLEETVGDVNLAAWLCIGMAVATMTVGVILAVTMTVTTDRELGVLEHTWVAPVAPELTLVGSVLSSLVLSSGAALIIVAAGGVLSGWSYAPSTWLAGPVVLLYCPGLAGLGYISASALLAWRHAEYVTDGLGYVIPMLSGVAFPVTILPTWLRGVAYALPTTWAMDLSRIAVLHTRPLRPMAAEIGFLAVTSAAFFIVGRSMFRRVEHRLRTDGTLSHY